MKKIFLHIKSQSNATATTDEAERSFGENDSLLAIAAPLSSSELCSSSSPMNSNNKYNHQNSSSILSSTQSSISSTTTSLSRTNKKKSPLKLKLKQQLKRKFSRSASSKDDSISEARGRAAARNVPPPFTTSKLLRLNELKEAKLRAEERREERSLRGGGSGGGRDYGSSSLRGDSSIMSIRSTRTAGETSISISMGGKEIAPIDEIQFIQQNGIMFVTCLLLQFILLFLYNRQCTEAASASGQSDQLIIAATTNTNYQQVLLLLLLPISLIIIQSLTLYTLLNTILVYAIDNINVGQNIQLVSNLDFGKRLYIVQVVTYTKLLSVGVGVFSVVGAMVYNGWRRLLGIKWVVCQYLNLTSSSCCKKMCNDDDGAMLLATNMLSPVSSWAHQAYNVSTFVTVRMIVFILAVLLLGHWKTDRMPRQ